MVQGDRKESEFFKMGRWTNQILLQEYIIFWRVIQETHGIELKMQIKFRFISEVIL